MTRKANPVKKADEKTLYRAAVYIRLSKEDAEKQESNSVASQRELIHEFLKKQPDILVCAEHVDDGYSGINFDRPGVIRLLQEIRDGEIDCVIVKDLSRFGRNYIETGRYIQRIFPLMGVRFIAVNDHYDSAGQESREDHLILPFRNLMNDSYCRDISIKVRSQIDMRQKKGDYVGSFPLFGYLRDPEHKGRLVIDETAASVVRDIFAMKLAGRNHRRIADDLNDHGIPSPMEYKGLRNLRYATPFKRNPQSKWSPVAVERILKNEMYTGTMVQGKEKTLNYKVKKRIQVAKEEWVRVEDTHEPIVSKEEFSLVQKLLLRDTRTPPGREQLCLFAGLLVCGDCGCSMVRKKLRAGGRVYIYYICGSNKKDKQTCASHRIREADLEDAVLNLLRAHIFLFCSVEDLRQEIKTLPLQEYEARKKQKQIQKRKEELFRSRRLKDSLYEDYRDGILEKKDYMEMKEDYERICGKMEAAVHLLEEELLALEEEGTVHSKQIECFKKEGNVAQLSRSLLLFTINKILIFQNGVVRMDVRYQNELAAAAGAHPVCRAGQEGGGIWREKVGSRF